MPKKRNNFTLSEEAIAALKRLSEAEGTNMSAYLDRLLIEKGKPNDALTMTVLGVYEEINRAIQNLEIMRDYDPVTGESAYELNPEDPKNHLSKAGNELLDMLNRFWDELREHPNFWEPPYPGSINEGA